MGNDGEDGALHQPFLLAGGNQVRDVSRGASGGATTPAAEVVSLGAGNDSLRSTVTASPAPSATPAGGSRALSPAPPHGEVVEALSPHQTGGQPSPPTTAPPSRSLIAASLATVLMGGSSFGWHNVTIPVFLVLSSMNQDCSKYISEAACASLEYTECVWVRAPNATLAGYNVSTGVEGMCLYDDYQTVRCSSADGDTNLCEAMSACTYDFDDDTCFHVRGWTALYTGIYAACSFVGAIIGPIVIRRVLRSAGFRRTTFVTAAIQAVASVLCALARGIDSYWLMVAGRVLLGAAVGSFLFLSPFHAARLLPPDVGSKVNAVFQPSIALGQLLVAVYGLAVRPSGASFDEETHMEYRIQGIFAVQFLLAGVAVVVAALSPSPPVPVPKAPSIASTTGKVGPENQKKPEESLASKLWPAGFGWKFLGLAVIVALGKQMTGIGPFVAFAPQLVGRAGLTPLLGNFLINFVGFLFSIGGQWVIRRFDHKAVYVGGGVLGTVACGLIALGAAPFVADASHLAGNLIAGTGLVAFSVSFNAGTGVAYTLWMLSVFPEEHRAFGTSLTNTIANFAQLVNTIVFPVGVNGIGGGPSGDERVGIAAMYVLFTALSAGIITLVAIFMAAYKAPADGDQVPSRITTSRLSSGRTLGSSPALDDHPEDGEQMHAVHQSGRNPLLSLRPSHHTTPTPTRSPTPTPMEGAVP